MFVGRTSCNENLSSNVNMLSVVDRINDLGVNNVARVLTRAN